MATRPAPPINAPMTDAQGRLSPEWVRYFTSLDVYVRALETRIADLEGP